MHSPSSELAVGAHGLVKRFGGFTALQGMDLNIPRGAFYAFLNVSQHFGRTLGGKRVENSTDFCLSALAPAHVAMVMGSAFGTEGYARLSFATDLETLGRGFDLRQPGWLKVELEPQLLT